MVLEESTSKEHIMKVCVFGSGGVGAYFGARLAASGADVTFVARGGIIIKKCGTPV